MYRGTGDEAGTVVETDQRDPIVGKIRTIVGSSHVVRSGVAIPAHVGLSLFQGDVIVTRDDGAVGIRFADGTAFNLASSTRMVLNEFNCDPAGTLKSGLLHFLQGTFSFLAGRTAGSDRLSIQTPFGTIRSTARGGGMGVLTLTALTFAIIKELQAASQDAAFLDDDLIDYEHLQAGVIEITTKGPNSQLYRLTNPGVTVVIRPSGDGTYNVEETANSTTRMLELQAASQAATATYLLGQQDSFIQQHRRADIDGSIIRHVGAQGSEGFYVAPTALSGSGAAGNSASLQTIKSLEFDPILIPTVSAPPPPQLLPPSNLSLEAIGSFGTIELPNTTGSSAPATAGASISFTGGGSLLSVFSNFISANWSAAPSVPGAIVGALSAALRTSVAPNGPDAGVVNLAFSAPDHTFDFLANGEILVITYNLTVTDGATTITKPIVINIDGTNDGPMITAHTDGAVESAAVHVGSLTDDGTVSFIDVDFTDTHTVSVSFVSSTFGPQLGLLTAGPAVDSDTTGSGTGGSVNWHFSVANDAVPALAFGQTITETYEITINDGHGGTAKENVDVTIANHETLIISLRGDATVAEGTAAGYTINLSNALAPGVTASVDIAVNLPAGLTGAEAVDFTNAFLIDVSAAANATPGVSLVGSTLTFDNAFDVVMGFTFMLSTLDDTLFEGPESFIVALGAPTTNIVNATIEVDVLAASVNSTIIDNDAANIVWSITGGGNVIEGGSPSFTVGYTGATLAENNTVSINLAFGAGATEPQDFIEGFLKDVSDAIALLPGTAGISLNGSILTFSNPAVTSLTFTLPTFNDALIEDNEAFSVSINTPSDGTIGVSTANLTIIDNDPLAGAPITLEVDEAALSTAGATGSNSSLTTEVDNSPTLSFTAAGFNLVSFGFSNVITGLVTDLNGDASQDIFWVRDSSTQISGYLDGASALLAVRLTLSAPGSIAAGLTGSVTVTETLSDNLMHLTANGAQVSSLGNVGVVATDTNGNTATGTVNLTVKDDTPKAVLVAQTVAATAKTNVMVILDLSGSMDTAVPGLTGLSRLDVAKAAINELLEQYDNRGDVMVRLVTFSSTGVEQGAVWGDVAITKALLASLGTSGTTDYDAGLITAMGAFMDGNKLSGPGVQNVSYFISDGAPTGSTDWPTVPGTQSSVGIEASEQAAWESFLTTNNIISYALGIPAVSTPANLAPIAFDPAAGTQLADSPIIVTDLAQLASTLIFSMPPVNGGFVAGVNGGTVGSFGADGGFVQSITVDSVVYTFNPTANGGLGGITSGGTFTYDSTTKTLTVDTDPSATGGELAIVMTTGAFTFQPTVGFTSESVGYVLIDGDGDSASNTLTFTASAAADQAPIVRDDHVITNQAAAAGADLIVIPDYALLYNDTDADAQTILITAVSAASRGTVAHASTNVTFTESSSGETDGGSFTYTGSTASPVGSNTGNVILERQTGTTLTGTGFSEILIGRDGTNNIINANQGDDVLIGGTGNDTLNSGAGNDMLDGGAGVDLIDFSGGTASVTFTLSQGSGPFSTGALAGGSGTDTYSNMEGVIGTAFNDNLTGSSLADTINGGAGADNISAGGGDDTINLGNGGGTITTGTGADTLTVNAGTSAASWAVDLGSDAVQDKIVFTHASLSVGHNTLATVSNFNVANDGIAVTFNGAPLADGAFQTVTSNAGTTNIVAGTEVVEFAINDAAFVTTSLGNDANSDNIEGIIAAAINDIPTGNCTFIVYSNTTGTANAGIYTVNITDNTNPGSGGMTVEHIMTLNGVGFGNLADANFVVTADPLILDLGAPGIAFTSGDNSVSFDINTDGVADQTAWTAGEDGILALDVDGNGTIDNGTEIFSPWFNGGSHTGSLVALAILDDDGDGVIDSGDTAFGNLQVWQDLDHDGISGGGELKSLADHGITEIRLNAAPSEGYLDGQRVLSEGVFSYEDGTSGDFIEVALDVVLGANQPSENEIVGSDNDDNLLGGDGHDVQQAGGGADTVSGGGGNDLLIGDGGNDVLIGGTGADTFKFADLGSTDRDTSADYEFAAGDQVDLSSFLDATGINDTNINDYIRLLETGPDITIQIDATGNDGFEGGDVATLSGAAAAADPVRVFFSGQQHNLVS